MIDSSMSIMMLKMGDKAMKRQTIIKKMMVLLISATMLVAGPGTGIFAFAEDNSSGAEDNAAVQNEETTQTGGEQAQTEGYEETNQQDMQEGSDGSGDAADAAEGEDASDGADDAQKTAENGEEPGVTQDASENDAAQTQDDAAAAQDDAAQAQDDAAASQDDAAQAQDDAAAAQSDAAQAQDDAAAAQSDAAQTQDDAAQAQAGAAQAQVGAAPAANRTVLRGAGKVLRNANTGNGADSESANAVSVNGNFFATLRDAILSAFDGDIVKVHGNTQETSGSISVDKNLTIIADAVDAVIENAKLVVAEGKSLVIGDGSGSGSKKIKNSEIETHGDLTLNDGFSLESKNSSAVDVCDSGKLTANGGSVTTTGAYALYFRSGSKGSVIRGGEFSGDDCAVYSYGDIDTISGGTFTGTASGAAGMKLLDSSRIGTISGGTFTGNGTSGSGILTRGTIDKIDGGVFKGGPDATVEQVNPNGYGIQIHTYGQVKEINGGSFSGGWGILHAGAGEARSLTINGGDFNGARAALQINRPENFADINGGKFTGGTGIINFGKLAGISDAEIETLYGGFYNYSKCGDISDTTITVSEGTGIWNSMYSYLGVTGEIGDINNCTIISNADDTREYAIENAYSESKIGSITGGTIQSAEGSAIYNWGTIGKIGGDVKVDHLGSSSWHGAVRNGGTIDEIESGSFEGMQGVYNTGTVNKISGGDFNGRQNALYNVGEIDSITGGNYIAAPDGGWFGIYNIDDGSIGTIEIAEGTGSVFMGPYNAIASYNGGTIGSLKGYGTFLGGFWGTLYTGGDILLEQGGDDALDLTKEDVNPGNGRYADNEEGIATGNTWNIPEGYHMSATKLLIPEMDNEVIDETLFAFLTKDNTIIYSGNGHELEKGTAAKGFRDTGLVFRDYESTSAEVEDNDAEGGFFFSDGNRELLGWNTKADGSGKMYKPGDVLDFSGSEFADGSDIILYAQWGEEKTPVTPGNDEPEEPETPAAEPETPAAEPEAPAAEPETPAAEPETPAAAPAARTAVPVAQTVAAVPAATVVPVATAAPEAPAAAAPAAMAAAPAAEPEGEVLEDPEVPLAAPKTQTTQKAADVKGWALVNLIAAVMTVLGAAYACIRRRKEDGSKGSAAMKLGGVIAAAASVITFIMNENLAGPMSITDNWTVIMIFILGAQIVTAVIADRLEESKEDQEA